MLTRNRVPTTERTITVFSNQGERFAEKNLLNGDLAGPYPQDILEEMGFNVVYNKHINRALAETVIWDREFVTGQNQFAPNKFGRLLTYAILYRAIHQN